MNYNGSDKDVLSCMEFYMYKVVANLYKVIKIKRELESFFFFFF